MYSVCVYESYILFNTYCYRFIKSGLSLRKRRSTKIIKIKVLFQKQVIIEYLRRIRFRRERRIENDYEEGQQ